MFYYAHNQRHCIASVVVVTAVAYEDHRVGFGNKNEHRININHRDADFAGTSG